MLYLFCGNDSKNKLRVFENFIKGISKKNEVFSFSRNNFDKMQLESLIFWLESFFRGVCHNLFKHF